MSFLNANSFVYNNKYGAAFGLRICWIGSDPEIPVLNREISKSEMNFVKLTTNTYGACHKENIIINFYIVKNNYEEITRNESIEINHWLMSPSVPQKLAFNDGEVTNIHYYAICTSIENVVIGGRLFGKKITFETNSPYEFADEIKKKYVINGNKDASIIAKFESNINYYCPTFEIATSSSNNIRIENLTTETSMTINLSSIRTLANSSFKKIIINNNRMTIIDGYGKLIPLSNIVNDIDNFQWIKLAYGKNMMRFIGNFEIIINCEFPRMAGGL